MRLLSIALVLALTSCIDVTIPADAGSDQPPSQPRGPGGVNPDPPGAEPGVPDASGGGLQQSDTGQPDAGAPQLPAACGSHCDCPPDFDCINERCVLGALPIQCCGHPLCPSGDRCWSASGVEGVCGGP